VAQRTGIPKSSLYALIKHNELIAVRYSQNGLIILESDLLDFLNSRRTGGAA